MFRWLRNLFKTRLYVKSGGRYMRVTGPPELLESVNGSAGYVVIGEELVIAAAFFSGENSVTSWSINGFGISSMTLTPITQKDRRNLGL